MVPLAVCYYHVTERRFTLKHVCDMIRTHSHALPSLNLNFIFLSIAIAYNETKENFFNMLVSFLLNILVNKYNKLLCLLLTRKQN